MKRILLAILAVLLLVPAVRAEESRPSTPESPPSSRESSASSPWSIGTSLTYPIANIYLIHVNYRINDRHEVFFGPCYQNFSHDSFTVHAYTLVAGYRYYLWKNLHLEGEIYPAYNNIYSNITDSYYPGMEVWAELKVGYMIPFLRDRFYLQPAPGFGFGIYRANRPPGFNEEIISPIFTPQLMIGMRL